MITPVVIKPLDKPAPQHRDIRRQQGNAQRDHPESQDGQESQHTCGNQDQPQKSSEYRRQVTLTLFQESVRHYDKPAHGAASAMRAGAMPNHRFLTWVVFQIRLILMSLFNPFRINFATPGEMCPPAAVCYSYDPFRRQHDR